MYHTTMKGSQNFAFPDLCKTPTPAGPIPLPYPNIAQTNTAVPPAMIVLIDCMPATNMGSVVPLSTGDEAGVAGGVVSNIIKGPCTHILGSFTLFTGGLPAMRLSSMTVQNLSNMVGSTITPSQTKVQVLG